jgi:hypothetical protein
MKYCKILASLLAVLLLWGCVPKHSQEIPVSTQPPTEAPTEAPNEAPTEEPTQAPTEPKPEWLLHSGIREDGSFDEGTLFIGDSLTCGFLQSYLAENDLVGDAWYMAMPGAALTAFFNGPRLRYNGQYYSYFSPAFADGTMAEGVEKVGENLTAVYLMMGTNHNDGVTEQLYVDVVGYILECCPNATVYLQRIPWSTSSAVDEDAANGRIQHAYEYYVNQGEIRVRLIDTQTFIDYNLTPDGVHLTWTGQRQWYEALVGYARYHEIPQ